MQNGIDRKFTHRIQITSSFQSKFIFCPGWSMLSKEQMECTPAQEFAGLGGDGFGTWEAVFQLLFYNKENRTIGWNMFLSEMSTTVTLLLFYCRLCLSPFPILLKSPFPLLSNISSHHNILSSFLIKSGASLFSKTDRFPHHLFD